MYHPWEKLYLMDPGITREDLRVVREASAWLEEEFGPRGVQQQPGKTAAVSLWEEDFTAVQAALSRLHEDGVDVDSYCAAHPDTLALITVEGAARPELFGAFPGVVVEEL